MLLPPPLALYVHLPWCLKKCPYCDFNSHALKEPLPERAYIDAVLADLNSTLLLMSDRPLISVFIGGGTPSLFSAHALERLLNSLFTYCSHSIEITLEANPGTVNSETLTAYRRVGINRISLGIQSFQDDKLKALGRIHDGQTARRAIRLAKEAGFININLDLMHGLPGQTITEGLYDLVTACDFEPTHISWYQLSLEPNTWFAHHPPKLPPADQIWDLQDQGASYLAKQGYQHYEISAYAQAGYQCQHNINYWQFGDYLGIGAGAHSKLTDCTAQIITRISKIKHPKDYLTNKYSFIAHAMTITSHELPFEFMLNHLRLYQNISKITFEERTGLSYQVLHTPLTEAQEKGLLAWDHDKIELTDLGRRFYNDLLLLFMPQTAQDQGRVTMS